MIGQAIYMVEGNSSNESFWGQNSKLRDNGVLKIGSYITILNPLPILKRLVNKIPIIKSRYPAVIMEPPRMVNSVHAEFGLVQNNTRDFFFKRTGINIKYYFPEVTKCSGLLCNQQLVRGVLQRNRGCK